MPAPKENFTIGLEEEYQIVDPQTYELSSSSNKILPTAQEALGDKAQPELQQRSRALWAVRALQPIWPPTTHTRVPGGERFVPSRSTSGSRCNGICRAASDPDQIAE